MVSTSSWVPPRWYFVICEQENHPGCGETMLDCERKVRSMERAGGVGQWLWAVKFDHQRQCIAAERADGGYPPLSAARLAATPKKSPPLRSWLSVPQSRVRGTRTSLGRCFRQCTYASSTDTTIQWVGR